MKFFKALYLLTFLVIFLTFLPVKILAFESIRSFNSLLITHADGTIDISEDISYDFGTNFRHGIFRQIPLSSKVGNLYRNLKITFKKIEIDNRPETFASSQKNGLVEIKIGDPDKTISGLHNYKIYYLVTNEITNFSDHDEIYWNVTGSDWNIPIASASAQIKPDFKTQITKAKCFTGIQGSTLENCSINQDSSQAEFLTNTQLNVNEGLSIVVAFPPNTFPKTPLSDSPIGGLTKQAKILLLGLAATYYLIIPLAVLFWYLKHKRKARFGKIAVNFDIPKDETGQRLAPAEAGIIDNAKLEKDDVTATIFDLAIRKYLKLVDQEKDSSFLGIHKKSTQHLIQKNKAKSPADLNEYEKTLYDRFFDDREAINVSDLKSDFYETFEKLNDQVFQSLVKKGFYTKNPATQRGVLVFLGILSALTLNILLSILMFYFSKVLNGRTQAGDEIDFKVDGLKIFLKNMKREYDFQAKNLYTVETYIPYAMALGLMDEFMQQLKIIYPHYSPSWYVGNNFYTNYPVFYSSMNSGLTTVAPSSSSGFSGGGFSGGGGGGGGGGSW